MIHYEDASKSQLIQICLYEDCPIEYKYQAAAELQMRQWHDDFLPQLLKLWGEGYSSFQIAIELGIDKGAVMWQLEKHGLYKKRIAKKNKGA